jgi:hypothetical protein
MQNVTSRKINIRNFSIAPTKGKCGGDLVVMAAGSATDPWSILARLAERSARRPWAPRALLHLINFDEPFGLSVVEALACGTPVIACKRGSMPELIEHGVTGFLVGSLDAAVDAIDRIDEIDRAACRARYPHDSR